MIKAIIFDFDGVIIDDEEIRYSTYERLFLEEFGVTIDSFKESINSSFTVNMKTLKEKYKIEEDLNSLYQKRNRLLKEVFSEKKNLIPVPGLFEFLKMAKEKGYKLAIGTANFSYRVNPILESLGISTLFDAIVTREEIKEKKPSPETFNLVASRLGVPSSSCIVIEDAPHGIEAARNAGMKCVAMATTFAKEKLQGADQVVSDFKSLDLSLFT